MYRRYTDGVPHPPLVSEYEGADSGGVPDLFVSMPATCRDVSDELLDFMWYREMSIPSSCSRSPAMTSLRGAWNEGSVRVVAESPGRTLL